MLIKLYPSLLRETECIFIKCFFYLLLTVTLEASPGWMCCLEWGQFFFLGGLDLEKKCNRGGSGGGKA